MLQPTLITWILVILGTLFIFLPTLYAQLLMVLRPHSQEAKDFVISPSTRYTNTPSLPPTSH